MSMHLRGSRDMMGQNEGWWQSRTGLEQKLIILSTLLFIVAFSLTIAVIVLKNGSATCHAECTGTPICPTTPTTEVTGDVTTVTGDTDSTEPPASTASEATTGGEATTGSEATTTSAEKTESVSSVTETASTASVSSSGVADSTIVLPTGNPEKSGAGSINARPARFFPSPRVLANVNGEVLGA